MLCFFAIQEAARRLQEAGIESARLDAEVLMGHCLGIERLALFLLPRTAELTSQQAEQYAELVARRLTRCPVAYLTGHKEFFGRDFAVAPQVLIPRPETELLVECALPLLSEQLRSSATGEPLQLIDVGTGSGIIACSVAASLVDALPSQAHRLRVFASDISSTALQQCRANIQRCQLSLPVGLLRMSLLDGVPADSLQMVISNPPYVAESERPMLAPELSFEPAQALFAGDDGLAILRRLSAQACVALKSGGWLLLEHGAGQAPAIGDMLRAQGGWTEVKFHRDLAELPRVASARRQ